MDKSKQFKFILGLFLISLLGLWYFVVIKQWLIELGYTEKLLQLMGFLICCVTFYVSCINNTFSQAVKTIVNNIYDAMSIIDLVGSILGISLFIWAGMRSFGVKFEDFSKEYFLREK